MGIYEPGFLYSIVFLLYSWGSLFGVPIRKGLCGKHGQTTFDGDYGGYIGVYRLTI